MPKLETDFADILNHTPETWKMLCNKTLFVTGGTGFIGKWLVESFCYANEQLALNAQMIVLSRNPEKFFREMPYLKNKTFLKLIKGDVRNFDFPTENIDFIIHGATDVAAKVSDQEMSEVASLGTARVLELAKLEKISKLLLISSGAVYGPQPAHIPNINENFSNELDKKSPGFVYAESKRNAENLCLKAAKENSFQLSIARCFAFIGPHMPLNGPFAITQFLNQLINNEPVLIKGNSSTERSYLYASDMAIWLWQILACGQNMQAYNVGSNHAVSIKNLAELMISTLKLKNDIVVENSGETGKASNKYVPDVSKVQKDLGLSQQCTLTEAILKTWQYHIEKQK